MKLIEQQLKEFHLFSIDQQDLVAIACRDVAPEELENTLPYAEFRGSDFIWEATFSFTFGKIS